MELNTIFPDGLWGKSADRINRNFERVGSELDKIKYAAYNNKLYATEVLLRQELPSPKVGDWAIVGSSIPGAIYRCDEDGIWIATGETGGGYGMEVTEMHVAQNVYTGDFTNAADNEDLVSELDEDGKEVLKLADKPYDAATFSGMGRVYLRKNLTGGKNVLAQEMMSEPNTRYIIQYDYDLNGATLTVPEGCTLDFQGGSLKNGQIIGNETKVESPICSIFSDSISLTGYYIVDYGYPEWFDNQSERDKSHCIQKALDSFQTVRLVGNYAISKPIIMKQGQTLEGSRYVSNDNYNLIRLNDDFSGTAAVFIDGPGVKMKNFAIQGDLTGIEWYNSTPHGVTGISFYYNGSFNSRFASIERVKLSYFGVGIDVMNYYGMITHCSIYYNNIGIRYGITSDGSNEYSGSTPIIGCHIRENAIGCYFSSYVNLNDLQSNTFEFNKIHVHNDGNISINGGYFADSPKVCIEGKGTTNISNMEVAATTEDRYGESVHIDRYTMIGACLNGRINATNCKIGIDNPLILTDGKYEMKAYSTVFGDGIFELHSTKLILNRRSAVNLSRINTGRVHSGSDRIDNYIVNGTLSDESQAKGTLMESINLFGNREVVIGNYDTYFYYEIPKSMVGKPMLIGVAGRYVDYDGMNFAVSIKKDSDTFELYDGGSNYYSNENSTYYILDFNTYINKMNYLVVRFKKSRGAIDIYCNKGSYTTKPVLSFICLIGCELSVASFGFLTDKSTVIQRGVSSSRPLLGTDDAGSFYYDETVKNPMVWNGSNWMNIQLGGEGDNQPSIIETVLGYPYVWGDTNPCQAYIKIGPVSVTGSYSITGTVSIINNPEQSSGLKGISDVADFVVSVSTAGDISYYIGKSSSFSIVKLSTSSGEFIAIKTIQLWRIIDCVKVSGSAIGIDSTSVGLIYESDITDEILLMSNPNACETSNRPKLNIKGMCVFDTSIGKPVWWDGTNWVDANGSVV